MPVTLNKEQIIDAFLRVGGGGGGGGTADKISLVLDSLAALFHFFLFSS